MELVKLTKRNVKNDKLLLKHLTTKPKHKTIVTITPQAHLWHKMQKIVEDAIGDNKMSKILSWMVDHWVDFIHGDEPPGKYNDDKYKTTLHVDQELWERFEDKIFNKFARYRMQSDIINEILENYLDKHYPA